MKKKIRALEKPLLYIDMFEGHLQLVMEHEGLPSHLTIADIDTHGARVTKSNMVHGHKYYFNDGGRIFEIAHYQTKYPGFDIFVNKQWIFKFSTDTPKPVINVLEVPPESLQILTPQSAVHYGFLYAPPYALHVASHGNCAAHNPLNINRHTNLLYRDT